MHPPTLVSVLFVTYWTILVAELIGDKMVYTVASLATRYAPANVYAGISAAFMLKMFVAVLFGQVLLELPRQVTALVSAVTLFTAAVLLARKGRTPATFPEPESDTSWTNVFAISFATIFFSEWADVGQISTAAMVAHYRMPLPIWSGATAALMTKGLLALSLGAQLRRRVPTGFLKVIAVGSCCILGVIALVAR